MLSVTGRRRRFRQLMNATSPLLLPGAYDALSAKFIESAGFDATYIGSFAACASAYGMPDVGLLTLTEMTEEARRVANAVELPVLVDAEGGFYEAPNIWRAVQAFEAAGVAGVHIEDNLGGKHSAVPLGLLPRKQMEQRIRAAVDARTDPELVIIARSDAAWVNKDLDECLERLETYVDAGADAVFAPAVTAPDLAKMRSRIKAPVMVPGDLLDVPGSDRPSSTLAEFADAGADVILLFYTLIGAATKSVATVLRELRAHNDLTAVDDHVMNQRQFEDSMGYRAFEERSMRYSGVSDV